MITWHLEHAICLSMLKENLARVSTNVARWLWWRDRNVTRNITLAHNASFSNWFYRVSINFWKKYVITFFIVNLTSYIFLFNFFSLPRLGTKLCKVIGKKNVFSGHRWRYWERSTIRFRLCCLEGGVQLKIQWKKNFGRKFFHYSTLFVLIWLEYMQL